MTISSFLSALPTISLALINGVRFGQVDQETEEKIVMIILDKFECHAKLQINQNNINSTISVIDWYPLLHFS